LVRKGALHAEGAALFEQAVRPISSRRSILVDPVTVPFDLVAAQADAAAATFERAYAINNTSPRCRPPPRSARSTRMIAKAASS